MLESKVVLFMFKLVYGENLTWFYYDTMLLDIITGGVSTDLGGIDV